MNKRLAPNMATTPMLQFIKPPERFDIGVYAEKFIEECKKFFELTQTTEEHRGIFIKTFLSIEARRKYEECKIDGNYKKRVISVFVRTSNLSLLKK